MIKTIIKTVLTITVIVGIMVLLAYSETHYKRTGFVKCNGENVYTFKDESGNMWDFYSNEIIPINAHIQASFFTNNTLDNITDDMVTDYKIIGYTDEVAIDF
jgi:hypothetical protein